MTSPSATHAQLLRLEPCIYVDAPFLSVFVKFVVYLLFHPEKNSTTGADASGKYQLAGIHKFINALTTHSELLSHPHSAVMETQKPSSC